MGGEEENGAQRNRVRRHLPPGTGEYSVGCVDIMCDHTDQGSFFRLYYPIDKTDMYKRDKQWPLWLPRDEYAHGYAYFLGRHPKLFGKVFKWLGGGVYVPALWEAPLIASGTTFPVVIFSHGLGGNRTANTTMCCELASQGFIVAAVEHRDGSASMTYHLKENIQRSVSFVEADGTRNRRHTIHRTHIYRDEWKWFEKPKGIAWDDFNYRNKQVHHRADECISALDILTSVNDGNQVHNSLGLHFNMRQLKNRLDLSRVAVIGHSFGGATSVCTLSRDNRFKTAISLDGWMHPLDETVYKNAKGPILFLNMETFQWKKNVLQMKRLQEESSGHVMITVRGTCHQSVTDFQFIANKPLGRLMNVRYTLDPKIAMGINNKATLGFLCKNLDIQDGPVHDAILEGRHELVIRGTNLDLS